jgi:hypothetical protein
VKRRRRVGAIAAALGIAGVVFAPGARAEGPTKDECINANDAAQTARQDGKLREAKKQLRVCVAKSCPGPVRDDCTERMTDVEKAIPTVVFAATDAQGNDLSDVRVTVDGEALAERLDGAPVAVDPGAHVFRFETAGGGVVTKKVVVRETEKARRVSIAFSAKSAANEPPGTGREQDSGNSSPRWPIYAAFAGAGVGLAVGVVFTVLTIGQRKTVDTDNDSARACNTGACSHMQLTQGLDSPAATTTLNRDFGAAITGYAVAALGAGLGTYLFVKLGGGEPTNQQETTTGVVVTPWVGFGNAGIMGRF